MSPAEIVLSRLTGVRPIAGRQGEWMAFSPLRDEKTASLHITEWPGTIGLHDYGDPGNSEDTLAAIGLSWADLYTEKLASPPRKRWYELPDLIAFEAHVIALIAFDIISKRDISEADYARLRLAHERLEAFAEARP